MDAIIRRREMGGTTDYSKQYLTITALGSGTVAFQLGIKGTGVSTDCVRSFSYSTDGGSTWTTVQNSGNPTSGYVDVNSGDKVLFKGQALTYYDTNNNIGGYFIANAPCEVSGNIMSMMYGDDFRDYPEFPPSFGSYTSSHTFKNFFENCYLMSADNLVLPATTLVESCYSYMFDGCTSLVSAPKLPATTLAPLCYEYMFSGCTSLETAPELSATTLVPLCYQHMFDGCTQLVVAPKLPATTLTIGCYLSMFSNCSSLAEIVCLATDISATMCTSSWVSNVSAWGKFYKPSTTSWTTGANGIPSGWTIQNV